MIEVWSMDINGNEEAPLVSYIVRDLEVDAKPNDIIRALPWHDERFPWEDRPYVEFAPVNREGAEGWVMNEKWSKNGGDNIRFYYIEDERHFQFVIIVRGIHKADHRQKEFADKPVMTCYTTEIVVPEED